MALLIKSQKLEEIFENCWNEAICEIGEPASFVKDIRKVDYQEFIDRINSLDKKYIKEFVYSFYCGIVFIFTDVILKEDLMHLKERLIDWSGKQKFTDPSAKDDAPDTITARDWHHEDHGFGYSSTYDMIHFFRWNNDPIGAFKLVEEPYRLLHAINSVEIRKSGVVGNFKKVVDRIEINRYPPVNGGIAFHSDPIDFTRFAMTLNLTQFGVDYKAGGFGVGLGNGNVLPIDPLLEMGSMIGFLPKVCHGVEIIDPYGPSDLTVPKSVAGRWYLAMAMVNRELEKDREVTSPYPGYPTLREQIQLFQNKKGS